MNMAQHTIGSAKPFKRRPLVRLLMRYWRLNILFLALFVMFAAYQTGWMAETVAIIRLETDAAAKDAGLLVKRVNVSGTYYTRENVIREAAGLDGVPMHRLDLNSVRARVESIAWVQSAIISRRWPDAIAITIRERVPFAVWQIKGEQWLIDKDGVQITQNNLGRFASLPFIVGDGAAEAASTFLDIISATPQLAERISSAIRVGKRRWDIEFDTGARLRLPEDTPDYGMADAWAEFAKLEQKYSLMQREVAVYDLRLRDRYSLRLTSEGEEKLNSQKDERAT